MGVLQRLGLRRERQPADIPRADLRGEGRAVSFQNPADWFSEALIGGQKTYTGKSVSAESAAAIVPVYSSVTLLAGSVSSLPLIVYRRRAELGEAGARMHTPTIADPVPGSRQQMLLDRPHPELPGDELWALVMTHLALWGNAFVAKFRTNGRVSALWPLKPSRVQVGRIDDVRRFDVDQQGLAFSDQDILHIRGPSLDGLVGLSPIQQARQMLGGVLSLEEFSGRFWSNNARPGGVIQHPNKLSKEAAERLKTNWRAAYQGLENAHLTAVLEEGATYAPTVMPLEDAQFIETQRFNDLRIAQLFRVPPHMLGGAIDSPLTYSTTESQAADFVRWTLRPWLTRIEHALAADTSLFPQRHNLYPEFLTESMLRADIKTRYEVYASGIESGVLEVDEARAAEGKPPRSRPVADDDDQGVTDDDAAGNGRVPDEVMT